MAVNWKDRATYFGIIALGIPFSISIGNLFLFLGGAGLLFLTLKQSRYSFKISSPNIAWLYPLSFFGMVLTSALFSGDVVRGMVQVDKHLVVALYGLIFMFCSPVGRDEYEFTLKAFTAGTFLVCGLLLLAAIIKFIGSGDSEVFFFFEFGAFLDLHPVYIAINLVISSLYLIHEYSKKPRSKEQTLLFVGVQIIFVTGLLLCASKAVLVIFAIMATVEFFLALRKKSQKLIGVLIIGILLTGAFAIPQLHKRFSEGLHFDLEEFRPVSDLSEAKVFSNEEKANISDLEIRYLLWSIGLHHWDDDRVYLFGYGIGDVQHYLDYYYMYYGLAPSWFEGYNLHNQYLQYLITYGIVGFCLFIAYLLISYRNALITRNRLHLYFLILISGIFIFECLLSRNKGLAIFIFLNTIFLSRNYIK
ncbi:O-antigen ligase family protein [Robiginitalea marina]|uniref:O-antigen ligase family protein n=1 Tax=Robiginitalea marina TaxID=2954105 RepID=A0ABT1AVZ7_9FLAO|nr:O-antigen ligase family protein [Robiginitalea marina]MCO5724233.1 O-antigen ligase family protein [Robiginitalea marina]